MGCKTKEYGFISWQGQEISSPAYRHALRSTQDSYPVCTGSSFSYSHGADVKNAWTYASIPHIFKAWHLIKHRDNFTRQHNLPENKLPLCDSKGRETEGADSETSLNNHQGNVCKHI
jgi:hypothetical protein